MSKFVSSESLKSPKVAACDVWVLGAGITGITTALVLQALGLKVAILSQSIPMQASGETPSACVPTSFAMASAYPHNLRVQNLLQVSDDSQVVFQHLLSQSGSGVEQIRLFEVYEHEPDAPPLASRRMKFETFDGKPTELKKSVNPPIRPGAEHIWGWVFESYFADMPRYLAYLWALYKERGGVVELLKIDTAQVVAGAGQRAVFNCLGFGALELVYDRAPAIIMRGKQVLVPNAPALKNADGVPVAYNYTPTAEVFARADGKPEYVHFFSRKDGWVLGQTREPGVVDERGRWRGEAAQGEEREVDGCWVPAPIIDLNDLLLREWLGTGIGNARMFGREGYRYYRDPDGEGVRLERDTRRDIQLIHNYGHGGSGITMSWGCALACARILASGNTSQFAKVSPTNEFDRLLLSLMKSGEASSFVPQPTAAMSPSR